MIHGGPIRKPETRRVQAVNAKDQEVATAADGVQRTDMYEDNSKRDTYKCSTTRAESETEQVRLSRALPSDRGRLLCAVVTCGTMRKVYEVLAKKAVVVTCWCSGWCNGAREA